MLKRFILLPLQSYYDTCRDANKDRCEEDAGETEVVGGKIAALRALGINLFVLICIVGAVG